MRYKYFVVWFSSISIIFLIIYSILTIIIDPLGIFNSNIIKGFNNYKVVQGGYIDVWKPYNIREVKPDIIFIGSSRVYSSIDTRLYETNKVVYNAGFSSLSLGDMREYLNMIYAIKKPEKVYIGLDLFQFSADNFDRVRDGFSYYRINNVGNKKNLLLDKIKDSLGVGGLAKTVKNSLNNKDKEPVFVYGYLNTNNNLDNKAYYDAFNDYMGKYGRWNYSEKAMECFKGIVLDAQKNDVELVVYFNPMSIEIMGLVRAYDLENHLDMIKKEIVSICGVLYDFNYVNENVMNKELFFDASHSNRKFGKIIIQALHNNVDSSSMLVLNRQNIDRQLDRERKKFLDWKNLNIEFYNKIVSCSIKAQKVEEGAFKKYIGF